jgi:hypothetical protein
MEGSNASREKRAVKVVVVVVFISNDQVKKMGRMKS